MFSGHVSGPTMTRLGAAAVLACVATLPGCGRTPDESDKSYALAWSVHDGQGYRIDLHFYNDFRRPVPSSVEATGPELAGSQALTCSGSQCALSIDVTASPPPPPLAYSFTVVDGSGTRQYAATMDCYLPLPVPVSPPEGSIVTSPVTFEWTSVGVSGIEYLAGVASSPGAQPDAPAVVDQTSRVATLGAGTWPWGVWARGVGLTENVPGRKCESRAYGGSFTVQ